MVGGRGLIEAGGTAVASAAALLRFHAEFAYPTKIPHLLPTNTTIQNAIKMRNIHRIPEAIVDLKPRKTRRVLEVL